MKIDTKRIASLTKVFNGVPLCILIDYLNYLEDHGFEKPTNSEISKFTGRDLSTIELVMPFLRENGYLDARSDSQIKYDTMYASSLRIQFIKTLDSCTKDGAFTSQNSKDMCIATLKEIARQNGDSFPTRKPIIEQTLAEFMKEFGLTEENCSDVS